MDAPAGTEASTLSVSGLAGILSRPRIHPPDWAKHAVFYQIFPNRFARSGEVSAQESTSLRPWA